MSGTTFNKYYALAILGALPAVSGCSHINVRQVAYETLRQADCRSNELEEFCSRNFASEFHEYDQARREFIRSQTQRVWRASLDEEKILEALATF